MEIWIRPFLFWRPENARGNALAGCVAAVLLVAVILLLRYFMSLLVPEPPRLILLTPVILVATLVGGATAGLFSLVLTVFVGGGLIWLESEMPPLSLLVTLAVFAVAAGFVIWIAAHYRSVMRELRELEDRRTLFHRELLHRSRNLQMVIHSIVRHTLAGDRAKADEINGRIASLVAASHLLNQSDDQRADLATLLRTELQPHGLERLEIEGPRLQLPSMHAKVVALVFHELGTNAAKHGSLGAAGGRVRISWSVRDEQVAMDWLELDGPSVTAPSATGFGTVFVERMLESVQGKIATEYGPDGFSCVIEFRLPSARGPGVSAYDGELSPRAASGPTPASQ